MRLYSVIISNTVFFEKLQPEFGVLPLSEKFLIRIMNVQNIKGVNNSDLTSFKYNILNVINNIIGLNIKFHEFENKFLVLKEQEKNNNLYNILFNIF